jgi:hypothetical protein
MTYYVVNFLFWDIGIRLINGKCKYFHFRGNVYLLKVIQ